ncbi:acyl-CoA-binding protein [Eisenibacter elegans]|jgi:acyl-CoA-binding protein|uniref:acyl-CoA-binding protein n=1 Tax=Eisenibacter elegans TaxID=997 RepID=UPI00040EAF0B|nr:acyl-CoA-binding protein [Eisenibacter elegans]
MDLQAALQEAVEKSKQLTQRPSNEVLLQLYAFYKQATEGDVSGDRPGMFDMKGRFKYDAWEKLKGMGKDVAAKSYIDLINSLS